MSKVVKVIEVLAQSNRSWEVKSLKSETLP